MGVDATYYIGGFKGETKLDPEVINAAEELDFDTNGMKLSVRDDPASRFSSDDGFCVVVSLARAFRDGYSEMREKQIAQLAMLFPNRPIYFFCDLDERDDVVELIAQDYDYHRVVLK